MYDLVGNFAKQIGAKLVMGINAGPGPRLTSPDGITWAPDNLLRLLKYSISHQFPILGFEFGNEPNLFPSSQGI